MRFLLQGSAVAVLGIALAGTPAVAEPGNAPQSYTVIMQIVGFEPRVLIVKPGDKVTWVNKDLLPHTATADDKAFNSKSVAPTGTWTYIAGRRGTHTYTCTFHPTMQGTIKVR